MGKLIETTYSDIEHQILKTTRRDKGKQLLSKTEVQRSHSSSKKKRKFICIQDNEQPLVKKCRIPEPDNEVRSEENDFDIAKITETEISTNVCVQEGSRLGNLYLSLSLHNDEISDLFLEDELRNSHPTFVNEDFYAHIVEEIGLEGLDGITIEDFWARFSNSADEPIVINDNLKEVIWRIVQNNESLKFYELPSPRAELIVHNRYKYLDPGLGVVMEMAVKIPDIYPYEAVINENQKGSCSTFYTREDVTEKVKEMHLMEVLNKYGRKLVIVADQSLRTATLLHDTTDPEVELQNVEYCILERIARSRKLGELTQGSTSINTALKMDSQSIFHYVKNMIHNNLVAKQFFFIKSAITDQNKMGRILHLKRFYTKIKPKQIIIAEKIVNVLKRMPGYRMDIQKIKSMFTNNSTIISKIMKSSEFHKYVKTDSFYEYRAIYPDATKSEYMKKNVAEERLVRCCELVDPHANVTAGWLNDQEESEDEDDEDKEEELTGSKIFNMELVKEVYYHIFTSGQLGISLQDLNKKMGVDHSVVRTCIKKLIDREVIDIKLFDKGKQRKIIYYAKCLNDPKQIVDLTSEKEQRPVQSISKYKAMILEKQKIANKKYNQEQSNEIEKNEPVVNYRYQKIMDLEPVNVPKCDFYFLLKHYQSCDEVSMDYEVSELSATFVKKILKLSFKTLNSYNEIEFNAILDKLTMSESMPVAHKNYDNYLSDESSVNYVTKLILLKACFNEIVINSEFLTVSRKRKIPSPTIPKLEDNVDKLRGYCEKFDYMGDNPEVVFHEVEGDVDTEIVLSTKPKEFRLNKIYPKENALTLRIASRLQIILDTVNEKTIFEDSCQMVNVIHKTELQEGYVEKIARKSLARLLKKLVDEGYIKIYKLNAHNQVSKKNTVFICHPSAHHTNSTIENARQAIKWKYFIGSEKKSIKTYVPNVQKKIEDKIKETIQSSPFLEADVMNSISELREMNKIKIKEMNSKYNRRAARINGYKPKFIRMRILHEFLFYLVYGSNIPTTPLTNDQVRQLFRSYCIDVPEEMLGKIPKIYCNEISWKMFIPPLPEHKGWPSGWALICDIILRLPVSVFCKLHYCSYEISELSAALNHPIERFYLVKDLPQIVRNAVLYKRKYIFSIQDALSRLAFCGLIQYGPQKYKEKDQVFIYLNRLVSLLDTTTSEPAYHKVTKKEYKTLKFTLNTIADVDSYWCKVYSIGSNTKLNARAAGQLITYIDPSAKPELMKSLLSKTHVEALQDDTGEIPGDQRGAAGLDSSLWCHITRNWIWANGGHKSGHESATEHLGLTQEKFDKLTQETPFANLNKVANKVYLLKKPKEQDKAKKRHQHTSLRRTSKKVQKITKRLPPRQKKLKRQYYDQVDKNILKKIGIKMRVRWSNEEDRILLLCKAGDLLLHKKKNSKQIVPYHVLRDLLHRICPKSKNKTSRACQRRLKILLKEHMADLEDGVINLMNITPIRTYYSPLLEKISTGFDCNTNKLFKLTDQQLISVFVILMSHILRNKQEAESVLQGNLYKDDHLSVKNLEHVDKYITDVKDSHKKYFDPITEEDIKLDVIKSVVLCSLSCENHSDWAAQLYKIYEKYPNILIKRAVEDMKAAQIISCRKIYMKKETFIWQIPFKLSQYYFFVQHSTFHSTSALQAYKSLLYIMQGDNNKVLDFSHEIIESKKYGQMLGINEISSFWEKMHYNFHLPQNTVILNPEVKDHSELLEELATRWQLKMRKIQQEQSETEQESDTETYRSKDSDPEINLLSNLTQNKSSDLLDPENTLDLTNDNTNSKTIDRLKTWVTDCMEREKEIRSPSPEFVNLEEEMLNDDNLGDSSVNPESSDVVVGKSCEDNQREINEAFIPTLDEIKKGMMEVTAANEDRRIPYVTELSDLLNRENFSDLGTSEETLEKLKQHFITQYVLLESVTIDEMNELNEIHIINYLKDHVGKQKVWEKVKDDMIVKEVFTTYDISKIITQVGGNQDDVDITNEIIEFVKGKKCFGVTAQELKEMYAYKERNLSLKVIVSILVKNGIFLRTGICTIIFVYFKFQMIWLIETVVLSTAEQKEFRATNPKDKAKEMIERQLRGKKQIHVKVMPWTKVDGSLNRDTFQTWLCNILSHCLNYPNIGLPKLCEKFRFIKPVDIYYLLEILQELECIELHVSVPVEQTLYSEWKPYDQSPATFLDDFQHISIRPNNVSMLCLGSFFYQNVEEL